MKKINFDDLQSRRFYRGFRAYHQSKLAKAMSRLFDVCRELAGLRADGGGAPAVTGGSPALTDDGR